MTIEHTYTLIHRHVHKPVEVPDDAGSISADADQDTVWFADKKTCDLICVPIQVNLRLHFHLRGLEKEKKEENSKNLVQNSKENPLQGPL